MRLNILAIANTNAFLWGGAIFMVAMFALIWPGYGRALLEITASIYLGYQPGDTFGSVNTRMLNCVVDGSAGGRCSPGSPTLSHASLMILRATAQRKGECEGFTART